MTEVVEKRMEMMMGELEDLQRIKLFTRDEIRKILARRNEFEHKIQAVKKDLKCFQDYISYERCLIRDVTLRRNKFKISEKKGTIEHKILKRIKNLYEVALLRFPDDIPLFLSFLKFCKQVNYVNAASDAVSNMIKKHPDNPEIWLVAASWHAYDRKDLNAAMIMLLKGVAIHTESQILYKEMIKIELSESTQKIKKETCEQLSVRAKKLEKIVKSILENIKDANFYIEILSLLENHLFTAQIQETIITQLITNFADNEHVWHILAQRERKDLYVSAEHNKEPRMEVEGPEKNTSKPRTPKARLEACFAKYEQGLAMIKPSQKEKLWSLYLDFLFKLQQETHGGGTVLKRDTLKAALNRVAQEGYLSEKHYIAWIELVSDDEALEIAERGTNAIPHSIDLWKARLRLRVAKDVSVEVDKAFKLGINALGDKALPLWSSILRYHYLTSDDDFIEAIYEDGVKQVKEISDVLKPQYLEWLTLTRGIEATRKAYDRLAKEKPYCKDLHVMMSKLESMQIDFNFQSWITVHKLACEQFGKEDVDVWINYIQFYLNYNKNIPDLSICIQTIRRQAVDTMPKELKYLFETKYSMITESA